MFDKKGMKDHTTELLLSRNNLRNFFPCIPFLVFPEMKGITEGWVVVFLGPQVFLFSGL